MCLSALAVAGSLCLKRVERTHKEVKSICPLINGSLTSYRKVFFFSGGDKSERGFSVCNSSGVLVVVGSRFHQIISPLDIKNISSSGDFYFEITNQLIDVLCY